MRSSCASCGDRLLHRERRGPSATYCSGRCRVRAYRARKRARATKVAIPPCMRNRARWIRHDEEKRPLTTHGWYASVRRPSTWTSYVRSRDSEVGVGMGYVLGEGIGCIDLDDVIDERGRLAEWAARYIDRFRERAILVERSRSGRGVHIFLRMEEARGRRIREDGRKIEIYSQGRYIAVTGDRI